MQTLIDTDSVRVVCEELNNEWTDDELNRQIALLPLQIQQQILMYSDKNDKQLRVQGKLLLLQMMNRLSKQKKYELDDLKKTKNNQPYFEDDFNFSIAHAANMVICAGTLNKSIGVDVEPIINIDIANYYNYLSTPEIQYLQKSRERENDFFLIWTKKEALAKATGLGILLPFNSISVLENDVIFEEIKYQFTTFNSIKNYKIAVALSD